jgi:hypothetical protein
VDLLLALASLLSDPGDREKRGKTLTEALEKAGYSVQAGRLVRKTGGNERPASASDRPRGARGGR